MTEDAAQTDTTGPKKTVNLALQGGGAHGAFTWGVLDAILDDGRLLVEGISGTSAGAMNGAAYAYGWEQGGPAPAKRMLEAFWTRVAEEGAGGIGLPSPFADWLRGGPTSWNLDYNPAFLGFDAMSRFLSPYQFNPLNYNPLERIVSEVIDFSGLAACKRTRLFVSATHVKTGKIRVFGTGEITPRVLMASACLPYLFQAVEVDGEHYWDGGFMGNPALFPLIYECRSPDIVVVQVNPIERPELPETARAIIDRITEISFNSNLMREMRAIAFVRRLLDEHAVDPTRYKKLNIHFIDAEEAMAAFTPSSKYNTDRSFLEHLRGLGREVGERWLAGNFDAVGERSTVDLEARFL